MRHPGNVEESYIKQDWENLLKHGFLHIGTFMNREEKCLMSGNTTGHALDHFGTMRFSNGR